MRRNVRTRDYKRMLEALPERVRAMADAAFRQFVADPNHPGLSHHALHDTSRGRHRNGSWAVHVTRRYCAIYVPDGDTNVWYWIGSHEDYNNFVGK